MSEGIHKRIQAEIHHEDRERAFQEEERLDEPPGWNNVERFDHGGRRDLGGKCGTGEEEER